MVGAFPYAVRKTLYMMVAEFKTEIEVARCWRAQGALPVARFSSHIEANYQMYRGGDEGIVRGGVIFGVIKR